MRSGDRRLKIPADNRVKAGKTVSMMGLFVFLLSCNIQRHLCFNDVNVFFFLKNNTTSISENRNKRPFHDNQHTFIFDGQIVTSAHSLCKQTEDIKKALQRKKNHIELTDPSMTKKIRLFIKILSTASFAYILSFKTLLDTQTTFHWTNTVLEAETHRESLDKNSLLTMLHSLSLKLLLNPF